jgi:hypothetical protein
MVLPTSRRVSRVPRYSGQYPGSLNHFVYRILTFYDWLFQNHSTMIQFFYSPNGLRSAPVLTYNTDNTTPVSLHIIGLGSFRFRSPLLTESLTCFLFLEVLRWFTSLGSPPHTYVFSVGSSVSLLKGLPHSDICGSKPARDSPQLFAACHVLLRLWLPRHPPYALCSLTINFTFCHRTSSQKCAHLCSYYFPVVPFLFSFQRTLYDFRFQISDLRLKIFQRWTVRSDLRVTKLKKYARFCFPSPFAPFLLCSFSFPKRRDGESERRRKNGIHSSLAF